MVIEASGRHLTKDSDILPALSGLAQIVQKRTRQNYLAGHWQSDLPTSILWRALNTTKIPLPEKHRASMFPAPTWSWASVIGQIVFPDKQEQVHSEYLPGITILKASTTLAGLDPFGNVTGGYLKVSGKLSRTLAAKHTYGTTCDYYETEIYEGLPEEENQQRSFLVAVLYDSTPGWGAKEDGEDKIQCLQAYKPRQGDEPKPIMAIALKRISVMTKTYVRVGWVEDCKEHWFTSDKLSTIKII